MSQSLIGFVFSIYEMWLFLASPVYGNYLIEIGPRFAFIAGQFMAGGCSVLFGTLYMAPAGLPFIVLTFVLRSMMALGAAAFSTASFAMAANQFPEQRSTVLAALEICTGLGFALGPPLGGILYELGGFGLPFWCLGSFLILWSIINFFCLAVSTDSYQKRVQRGSMLSLLASPLIVVCAIALMSTTYSFGFIDAALSLHLHEFNVPIATSGLYFIILSCTYSAISMCVGWILGKKPHLCYAFPIFGSALLTVALLLIGPSPLLPFLHGELWLIGLSLAMIGLGSGAVIIPVFRCFYIGGRRLGFKDGIELEGLLSGLFTSCFHLGVFLGPTIGSPVMQATNYEWSATLNAGFVALSLILLIIYKVVETLFLKYDDSDIYHSTNESLDVDQTTPIPYQTSAPDNHNEKYPPRIFKDEQTEF